MDTREWSVADAKARLSEVIETAKRDGPQTITRNGTPAAVIVSVEEWERKTKRKGSLAEFMRASPLVGVELAIERMDDQPRDWPS
jgi:prevent-host-death family protein